MCYSSKMSGEMRHALEKNFVWKRDVYFIDPCYIPGFVDRQTMMVLTYYEKCITDKIPHYLKNEWSKYLYYFQDNIEETEPSPDSCFLYTDDFVDRHPELIGNCCLLLNWCEPLDDTHLNHWESGFGGKRDYEEIVQYYYDLYAINKLKPKYILTIFEADDYSFETDEHEEVFHAGTYLFHKWRLNEMKGIYDVIKEKEKRGFISGTGTDNIHYSYKIMLMRKK